MKDPQEEKNLPERSTGISRRSFLKGFGVTSVGVGVAATPVSELLTRIGETATKAAVILEGKSVLSCMTLAVDTIAKKIETVEGIGDYDGKLHEIQESFIEHDGLQCGFCTSGMLMSCKNLLDRNPNPSLLNMLQARDPALVNQPYFAKYDEKAIWIDDLEIISEARPQAQSEQTNGQATHYAGRLAA